MKKAWIVMFIALLSIAIGAASAAGTGNIRISPALPVMVSSPATFEIWLEGASQPPANDPHILLAMTEECFTNLIDDVQVTWTGGFRNFSAGDFTAANTGFVPTSGAEEGARYTVASLQSHLGVDHSEMIYYTHGAFLAAPITGTNQTFMVTLPSTTPRMLVYALGKSGESTLFTVKVPPTIPGFIVPEPAVILLSLASFGAFALFAVKRRK